MSRDVTVYSDGYTFLECPRWRDGQLYLSDFYTHRVLRIDGNGKATTVVEVPNQPSGLGWLFDGCMLIVSMKDHTRSCASRTASSSSTPTSPTSSAAI